MGVRVLDKPWANPKSMYEKYEIRVQKVEENRRGNISYINSWECPNIEQISK